MKKLPSMVVFSAIEGKQQIKEVFAQILQLTKATASGQERLTYPECRK